MVVIRYFSLFTAVALCAALFAQISVLNPFATHAKFSVDSEADTSQTAHPELLHPRLSLSSAVATIEPDTTAPRYSLVDINFYSFPFTQQDVAAARRGKIDLLNSRWHATASTNPKSADFNGGAWASIQITLNEARRIQEVRMSIPGYSILLSQRDLNNFSQQYQFDGKKLRLKSRDSYRLDLKSAGVASFTFDWDVDLTTPVFAKRLREE